MNVGYEEDELKPYIEPQPDYKDPRRTGTQQKCSNLHENHPILFITTNRYKSAQCNANLCCGVFVQRKCCGWDILKKRFRTHW